MPVVVSSEWINQGHFKPGALIMLQQGDWELTWPLDERVLLELDIRRVRRSEIDVRRVAHPRPVADRRARALTALPGAHVELSARERQQLAAMFAHLIHGEPPPDNLVTAAARIFNRNAPESEHVSDAEIKQRAHRVRRRINMHRVVALATLHELGEYLVNVAGLLNEADLEQLFPDS